LWVVVGVKKNVEKNGYEINEWIQISGRKIIGKCVLIFILMVE
jgi:hypothetical protein